MDKTMFEEVIRHLKFIASIKEGEKINTKSLSLLSPSYYSTITRTYSGETRKHSLKFIKDIFGQAVSAYQYYLSKKDDKFCKEASEIIYKNIQSANIGIKNLLNTYKYDVNFQTELNTLWESITLQIACLN